MFKKSFRKICCVIFLLTGFISLTAYADNFVVQKIQIRGLQGISTNTVYSYLPIKVGDRLTDSLSTKIISTLYRTGFFDNIKLDHEGNTLIVQVVQRPIISRINIAGNKTIKTAQLKQVLKSMNIVEGHVFNPSLLAEIKTSLKREYFTLGKYNAQVDIVTKKEPRHRLAVNINISEGVVAKIKQIKIIGNHTFSEQTLLKQFKLSTTGLFSFYTHNDQYSREKLEGDLESLRSYYMDRGYLKFKIDSTRVSISPDHESVYVTIKVTEGSQYKVSGYSLTGKYILPRETLEKLISLQKGQIFSRKEVVNAQKQIARLLSNKGYANANIKINPKINEKTKTVWVTFHITPGPRIYVRHVTFSDNTRTNDETFRRSILQFEGSVLSTNQINESKHNLLLLPYVRNVDVTTTPVPGVADQVDVNYKVTEQSAAEFSAGIAYSQVDKFMVTAAITHKNVFGTGNSLSLSVSESSPETNLNLTYYNPFYTKSGIGRSINVYTSHFNASKADVTDYVTNNYGFSVGYNFPVTRKDSFQLGYGYENVYLKIGGSPPAELNRFTNNYGHHFYNAIITGGWSSQGWDRAIFPTQGLNQSISGSTSVAFSKNSLEYYKLGYGATYYHPIYKHFLGQLHSIVNYGNGYGKYSGDLPFFKNFYAGGMMSNHPVRGYEGNSLGPKDSNNNPLGGKFAVSGTAGLIFPNPLGQNVRTTWFVDAGSVDKKISLSYLRYSTGLDVQWLSPVGTLEFSLAKPLNKKKEDQSEIFQFSIGTIF